MLPLVVVGIASLFPLPWPFVWAEHSKQPLVLYGLIYLLVLLSLRRWRMSAGLAVLLAAVFWQMWKVEYVEPQGTKGDEVTIVWAHVLMSTSRLFAALDYARLNNADLVLIAQFPWDKTLEDERLRDYPFKLDTGPYPDDVYLATRIVALSRLPMEDAEILPDERGYHRLFLKFVVRSKHGDEALQIIAAHAKDPKSPVFTDLQEATIRQIAEAAKPPFLIAADLNATPWSSVYRNVPGKRIGNAMFETTVRVGPFKSWNPMLGAAPIDHFLVSPEVEVGHYEVGPDTGSNHKPLLTKVRWWAD